MEGDYELVKVLGKGSFGEVVKARNLATNDIVAIKLLKNLFKDDYASKKVLSEIQLMRQLTSLQGNVYTSKLLDVVTPDVNRGEKFNYLFIVMDCSASDLKKVLASGTGIDFGENHVLCVLYNTLCGLQFLHSANVMHRDIKPANILIEPDCQVKLCDFGLSRPVPTNLLVPHVTSAELNPTHTTLPTPNKSRYGRHTNPLSPKKNPTLHAVDQARIRRGPMASQLVSPKRYSQKVTMGGFDQ